MNHDIKRMLELAAKAVGIDGKYQGPCEHYREWGIFPRNGADHTDFWNPKVSSGDSFKLQVTLGLLVDVDWDSRTATAVVPDRADMTRNIVHIVNIPEGSDGMAETRLAVLMAADAIGEAMP